MSSKPGNFYLLPKIHKPNNPGRPIISNNNTLTEHESHFVETLLKPYAQAANSFIQDTTDFLKKLKKIKTVPQNTILATLDVSSLYTNITHNNALKALKNRLPDNQLTDVIIQSTEFILKHNYFNFGNQQFLQLTGTAMGTKMAPQYANIFMANLEENKKSRKSRKFNHKDKLFIKEEVRKLLNKQVTNNRTFLFALAGSSACCERWTT